MANSSTKFLINFSSFVEKLCKTTRKTLCKSPAKLCVNLANPTPTCVNLVFSTHFSHFSHHVSHRSLPLEIPALFHYSTVPTITTINNIKERI